MLKKSITSFWFLFIITGLVNAQSQYDMTVTVRDTGGAFYVEEAIVNLYIYDMSKKVFEKAASSVTSLDGQANFQSIDTGKYLILAKPDTSLNPNTVPTYYGDVVNWDSAKIYHHTDTSDKMINLVEMKTSTTGNGVVLGRMVKGPNDFGKVFGPGDPLNGVDVSLIDKSVTKGAVWGYDVTHTHPAGIDSGLYKFANIPPGEYYIYCGITGIKGLDFTVNVTGSDTHDIEIIVDSSSFGYQYTNVEGVDFEMLKISIMPNPFKDVIQVEYNLEDKFPVNIQLLDINGKLVETLYDKVSPSGRNRHNLKVDAKALSAGVYFVQFKIGESIYTERILKY